MEQNSYSSVQLEEHQLKRGIKGWQVTMIALGGVMGTPYFLGIGLIVEDMGPAVVLGYCIVGVIMFGIMIAFAELIVNLPRRGAFVAYSHEFLGDAVAAGIGWSYWLAWGAFIPAEVLAGGIILKYMFGGSAFLYASVILVFITIVNLLEVKFFAKIESGLAITKVTAVVLFIICALGIWLGIWGSGDGFIGLKVLLDQQNASVYENLFPGGMVAVFIGMTLLFSTVGGIEIVGMTAAEAEEPEKTVPKACRSIVYRVLFVFIIPALLLVLLFPTEQSGIDTSMLAYVLESYGLETAATILSVVVIIAAISCSNTALYATTRDIYSLAISGLAPGFIKKLNKSQVPKNSSYVTLIFVWIIFFFSIFAGESKAYEYLITATGFAGAICWIGILCSQLKFRYLLKKRGYDIKQTVKSRIKWMPVPILALILLLVGLGYLSVGIGSFGMFLVACSAFAIPCLIFLVRRLVFHQKVPPMITAGEKTFNELFPEK